MLCFPQVLFTGAIVPVPDMAALGRAISAGTANRHAFEGLGRGLDLDRLGVAGYGDAFSGDATSSWLVLAGFTVAFVADTVASIRRSTRLHARRPTEPPPPGRCR